MRFAKLASLFLLSFGLFAAANDGADPVAKEKVAKEKFDPVKANGAIFENWPKPQVALLITGELDGYIEPCGCAGLENQLGGLKRRHTFIKDLQGRGWPIAAIDLGGLVKRTGPQSEIKYRYALESLVEMGYSAVGLGANDLSLDVGALFYAISNLNPQKNPMVSANAGLYDLEESAAIGLVKYRVIEAGGKRIGVTSVLGSKQRAALKSLEEVATLDPAEALAKVAPQLAGEKCDLQVLMVSGQPQEAAELGRKFPQFQVVVAAGGAEEPPKLARKIENGETLLIEPGHKGNYAIVLGLTNDPKQPILYQAVPLDARFADSPQMQAKMAAYQQELETQTLKGLGLDGTQHHDGDFASSAACAGCHADAWKVFEKTPHAHATETLVKRTTPPRQFDPECLSCHVTGWNPQEYFPYITGYKSEKETPALVGNGCENCHGPAAAHVKVESGDVQATDAERESIRAALRRKIEANEGNIDAKHQVLGKVVDGCLQCHDVDNSPDFDFQAYWPKVKHVGKN